MKKYSIIIIGIIAVIALILGITTLSRNKSISVAERVVSKGEIRIGYIVYPPLLLKNPVTGELSGISYDLVEAAAKNLGLKTNWVEEVGWGTAIEGLKTKRYDILGTQMWPNSARAREAAFSLAPMNSTIYPYARPNDYRFNSLESINSSNITIGVLDGEMASFIAEQDYPNAKVNALPQLSSYSEVFLNILNKKSDVAFVEPSVANDFLEKNPGSVVRIGNEPVRTLGNSFAFARGEDSMVTMWNIAMQELINDGTVKRTLEKYNVSKEYTITK
ncbi:MAG: transporter substrate-binding domain-containing protein [bacterium]